MIKRMLTVILVLLSVLTWQVNIAQGLVINEVMSDNESFEIDPLETSPDWIELYNSSDAIINLGQYALRFDSDDFFTLPSIDLESETYIVLFLAEGPSGEDGQLYINHPISRMGARISLHDVDESTIDEVNVPSLYDDRSYGRVLNGDGPFGLLPLATPGYPNAEGGISASESTGFFEEGFSLTLNSSSEEYDIRYTLDGSMPTGNSLLFAIPILIEPFSDQDYSISAIPTDPGELWDPPDYVLRATVIRAATFLGDTQVSPILSHTFFVDEEISSRYSFPIVSILADSVDLFSHETGIYVPGITYEKTMDTSNPQGNYDMRGPAWERGAQISFLEPTGEVGFESEIGIRIRGGWTPRLPQKSLNIYFKSEYGLKDINYSIFSNKELKRHKRLVLRNSGNDFFSSRFRDILCQDIFKEEGLEYQAYRPSVVFVNGEYWGIKNIREKYDEHYLKRHFGGDTDDYDIVGVCGQVEHGETVEYDAMITFIEQNDLAENKNYEYVKTKIDISNFIDYNIAEIFFANLDWPCNNHRFWKAKNDTARWRMMIYDMDKAFGFSESTYSTPSLVDATTVGEFPFCPCSNNLLRAFLDNEAFKEEFIREFYCQLRSTYRTENLLLKINQLSNIYAPEITEHAARWGYPWNLHIWNGQVNDLRIFAESRTAFMKGHLSDFFGLENLDYFCEGEAEMGETGLILFPNPTSGSFKIRNDTSIDLVGTLTIYNVYGQPVFIEEEYCLFRGGTNQMSISNLRASSYILTFTTPRAVYRVPLIIE